MIFQLDETEFIAAERFTLDASCKSFDLNFIGKDLKTVNSMLCVPRSQYKDLVEWTVNLDIILLVTQNSINWKYMLVDVRGDLKKFVENGGWGPIINQLDGINANTDVEEEQDESQKSIKRNLEELISEISSNDGEFQPPKSDSDSDDDSGSEDESSNSEDD